MSSETDNHLGDDTARHVLEHDKVSFVSDDQDEGVTRIEALCKSSYSSCLLMGITLMI